MQRPANKIHVVLVDPVSREKGPPSEFSRQRGRGMGKLLERLVNSSRVEGCSVFSNTPSRWNVRKAAVQVFSHSFSSEEEGFVQHCRSILSLLKPRLKDELVLLLDARSLFFSERALLLLLEEYEASGEGVITPLVRVERGHPAWGWTCWSRIVELNVEVSPKGDASCLEDVSEVGLTWRFDQNRWKINVDQPSPGSRILLSSWSNAGGAIQVFEHDVEPSGMGEYKGDHLIFCQEKDSFSVEVDLVSDHRYRLKLLIPDSPQMANEVRPFSLPGWVEFRPSDGERIVSDTGKIVRGRQDLPGLWEAPDSAFLGNLDEIEACVHGKENRVGVEISGQEGHLVLQEGDLVRSRHVS